VVRVSGIDEDAIQAELGPVPAEKVVTELAKAKAAVVVDGVAGEFPDAVVIGCDSMLSLGDELLGKPHTAEVARQRWREMRGRTGHLLTGHAVFRVVGGQVIDVATGTETTAVHFSSPTDAEIDAYVATGEPLSVAGAFTIDRLGGWFVDGVSGNSSSVVGISLPLTRKLLADVGISVADLWARH
jgi:septum formation protein